MLYIYVIQKRASPPEVYTNYFSAAIRCQSHISSIAEKGSLSERYCLVLEELRVEALRQTASLHHQSMTGLGVTDGGHSQENGFPTLPVPVERNPTGAAATNYADLAGDAPMDFNDFLSPALCEDMGWGQFASMVSGGFDAFLNDDPFRL